MYPPVPLASISAVYTQSGTVYDTDSLDSLKSDLVVTATYEDSTTETVTDYTLSGTLAVGTSTITVAYGGKTTTFTVTVSAAPTLSSISAVYTQSGTVYTSDSLDTLKSDLVVTATYSDQSTETVTTYTLSGTLTVGTSTITVSYGGKTTTFDVVVSESPDETLIYALPTTTVFDGTNYIDTEVAPFTSDHDFTLAFDFEWDSSSNQLACVFRCGEPRYVLQNKGNNMWRIYLWNGSTNSWDSTVGSGVRAKVVMAHTQGGGYDLYVLPQGGSIQSVTKTGLTLSTTNNTLYIGANQGNGSQYNLHGTVYDFKIYTRKWSADEISEYLTFSE